MHGALWGATSITERLYAIFVCFGREVDVTSDSVSPTCFRLFPDVALIEKLRASVGQGPADIVIACIALSMVERRERETLLTSEQLLISQASGLVDG